jgi:translation initiation factor 2 beta subunit (eIF-2beta)/eIF-5
MIKTELNTRTCRTTLKFCQEIVINMDDYHTQTIKVETLTVTVCGELNLDTELHTLYPKIHFDEKWTDIDLDDMEIYNLNGEKTWKEIQTNLAEYFSELEVFPEWHTMEFPGWHTIEHKED